MSKNNKTDIKALEQELQDQVNKINDAIIKVRRNELADVSMMDHEIADLCRRIIRSGDDHAKEFESRMVEIINRLDELTEELKEYQIRTTQDL